MSRPFYPLLFAVSLILILYAHNMGELRLSELWLPLAGTLGFASLVLLAAYALFRDARKAGVVALIFIVPFLTYGYAKDVLTELGWLSRPEYLIGTWVMALAVGAYLVVRAHGGLGNLTKILNWVAIAVVAFPAINIGAYELGRTTWETAEAISLDKEYLIEAPDIYYIILDMYPRADVLEEYYGFNNNEFIGFLESRGFHVPTNNTINHTPSSHSMASALGMNYLGPLLDYLTYGVDKIGEDETDMGPIYSLLETNKVSQFLTKWQGYEYAHIGSSWEMTKKNRWADANFLPAEMSDFHLLVYNTTLLREFPLADSPEERHRKHALYQFEALSLLPGLARYNEEPLFVFAHIVIPHGPYVFDRDGGSQQEGLSTREQILEQLEFCNKKLTEVVDGILLKDEEAVIVLQGDHGGGCEGVEGCEQWKGAGEPSELFAELITKNFVAYHLPRGREMLYDTITPVNTFRVIFNAYFGMAYEMLEDRQYLSSYKEPYRFIEVTKQ